jgi:hypothetical protein
MAKKENQSTPGNRIKTALKGLLDRMREEAEILAGLPGPRQPALQPVPVRDLPLRGERR